MEYKGYQHIERLGTSEVEGILDGECWVYPKVDGTNGQAYCLDGQIYVGSRKRFITPEDDNAGCAKAILANENICNYLKDHVGHHLFFEWLVPHTIKNYEVDAWRKPYVFDVAVETEGSFVYLPYEVYAPLLKSYGITVIEPMDHLFNPTTEQLMALLENNHYLMQGDEIGEGIVIKNYGYRNRYGRQTWAKIVRAEFHKKKGTPKPKTIGLSETEQAIVDKYVTEAVVQKEKAKIENEVGIWESKHIGRLLSTVWHTLLTEEAYHFVKAFKNPTINFKELNRLCNEKTKEILGI